MKKNWSIVVSGLFLLRCTGDPTTPSPVPSTLPTPSPISIQPVFLTPTPEPTPTPKEKVCDIDDAGTFTSPRSMTATMCVYAWPEQKELFHIYTVNNGSTIQLPNNWCGTADLQMDAQSGSVCPKSGFAGTWDSFKCSKAHVVVSKTCPTPPPTCPGPAYPDWPESQCPGK